jgi:hypothetical protein
MNRLLVVAACAVVLGACDKKEEPKAAAPAGDKPAAAVEKPKIGLDAPKNNPKTVEAAKKALACPWKDEFDSACADYKTWLGDKAIYDEETFVSMLEDPDEKVRFLAAKRLYETLGALDDKVLAERVLTVAEKSKTPREQHPLGYSVGKIMLGGNDLFPRIKALLNAKETTSNMRVGILGTLMKTNPENDDVFNLMRESVKNPDFESHVQATAFGAMSWHTKPAKCDAFLEATQDENDDRAGDATQFILRSDQHCDAHYDTVLKSIEDRVKAKKVPNALFADALRMLCNPKGTAKPPQVKKAATLAKKIAEDKKLEGRVRALGITAAAECDPKGAKAYSAKFKKETDEEIKESVARIERLAAQKKK